ncbi:MAG: TCP-1/cpn60 chaperonin family protein, partial [Saprospiraceae bacterium]|nr:TCP-1/cpn60 chaperonin family protein [Saprospiraceae bacterium]
MTEIGKPGVVFQPATYKGLQRGIDQLVRAISPTLGPRPRTVVLERAFRDKMPEFLDDGGTIARRVIQIQDRDADVGAMFLRQVLWNVREYVGDGTATTAVLFGSIFQQGLHYIAAGGNAMRLQHHLEKGLRVILTEFDSMTRHINGKQNLSHIAKTICYDSELADILGEIMDIVGEYGGVDLGTDYGRGFRKDYIEGSFWPNSIIGSNYTNEPGATKKILDEPAILISNLDVDDPQNLIPIVENCVRAGERRLVLIAANYSESAIGLIHAVNRDPEKFQLLAVQTPGIATDDQAYHMEDIAVLTGGVPRIKAAGDSLEYFKPDHLGHARQAWANKEYFGIIHGKGDPMNRRSHIIHL